MGFGSVGFRASQATPLQPAPTRRRRIIRGPEQAMFRIDVVAGACRVEERCASREVKGARIPASSAISPMPSAPLRLHFLSPLIEPSMRLSRTGLSFEIMRSPTRCATFRLLYAASIR